MSDNSSFLKSMMSLRLIIILSFNAIALVGILLIGMLLCKKAISISSMTLFMLGVICIWLAIGLAWLVANKIKIIRIHATELVMVKLLKTSSYDISTISYNDFMFETIIGDNPGIVLHCNGKQVGTIATKEYSNANALISFIKTNCKKNDDLEIEVWTPHLKIFIGIGVSLLCILFLVLLLH